jgi:alcohol dehydrogenase class IV
MKPFKFRMPREVIFESGSSGQAPEKALLLGSKRPLFITGRQMAKSDRLASLMDGCSKLGMTPGHWDRVEPEPPVELLEEAVSYIREGSFDSLIAFGGGSSMDFVKMAAVLAENPDIKVSDMVGSEKIHEKAPDNNDTDDIGERIGSVRSCRFFIHRGKDEKRNIQQIPCR